MQDEAGKIGASLTGHFKGFGLPLKGDRKPLRGAEQAKGPDGVLPEGREETTVVPSRSQTGDGW